MHSKVFFNTDAKWLKGQYHHDQQDMESECLFWIKHSDWK